MVRRLLLVPPLASKRPLLVLRAVVMLTRYACSDYINPIDLCNRLNTYIIPEAAVHGFLTFLFLINGYWIPLIVNLPLLAWNAKKYVIYQERRAMRPKLRSSSRVMLKWLTHDSLGSSRTRTCWTQPRSSGS